MQDGSTLLTGQLSAMQLRALRIREAVDSSPVFQGVRQGLDRLSELSKGRLTYAVLYQDGRMDEPNGFDTVVVLQTNRTVSGKVDRKPFLKPDYIEEFSKPLALAFTADGKIRSVGFTNVHVESGQEIYPAPRKKRFAFQRAKIDAANEAAIGKALGFIAHVAFAAGLVPQNALNATTPSNSSEANLPSATDSLRSGLKRTSVERFLRQISS